MEFSRLTRHTVRAVTLRESLLRCIRRLQALIVFVLFVMSRRHVAGFVHQSLEFNLALDRWTYQVLPLGITAITATNCQLSNYPATIL